MKLKTSLIILLTVAGCFFFRNCHLAFGQSANPGIEETAEKTAPADSLDANAINALTSISGAIGELQGQIINEKKRLQAVIAQEERAEIAEEIDKLKERADSLMANFETIATGIDRESFETRPQKHFDWKEEVQILIGPIMNELKSMTARPRLIENLRVQVAYYEKQIAIIKDALETIRANIAHTTDENLKSKLTDLENTWYDKGKNVSSQLTVVKYQLAEKLRERSTLLESGQNIVRVFFKSRGRNFIMAVIAFLMVFFSLRYVHRYIYKISPIHRTVTGSFYFRLADVVYHVLTFVAATAALLIVLYVCGDWVLLGLSFVFVFGLIWTAKQTLPRFYDQCSILLNLGTVKEHERVIYNGLPWRVASLQINTYLVNPELKGGTLRLPLRELKDIRSRPYHPDEPWFPSKENDWVILSDGTLGMVIIQTPEVVQLAIAGGSCKTYPTTDFLTQNPLNISKSFRISVVFGIDYQYQNIATGEIPDKLKEYLQAELINEGYEEHVISLIVEFKEMGDSSLDYDILVDFSGRVAKDYYKLSRVIQKIAMNAAGKHRWEIPYTTFTINHNQP
ncbi:MAG TPA: hypothetical protein VJ440_03075 [Candidatus Brocadiaceae bacterium]|nr:hypothetical protein [Candidatus Brocadiaceae bacterium]